MKLRILVNFALIFATSASLPAFADQTVHEVSVLNSTHWMVEAGETGESYPITLKVDQRCSFLGVGTLNTQTFRANIQVEKMTCRENSGDLIERSVRGFVVGNDQRAGVPIQCLDTFKNAVGSLLCLNATLTAGTQAHVVVNGKL